MTEEKGSRMALNSELIRTVSHYEKSPSGVEWESVLFVSNHEMIDKAYDYDTKSIRIANEDFDHGGITIHSEAQAKELFRAIKTAGEKIGWFEDA